MIDHEYDFDDIDWSRKLNLYNQNIDNINIYHRINPTINQILKLSLGNNNIGDQGVLILLKCLKSNNIITHLTMESNNISCQGCSAISRWLSHNNTLKHLGLGGNQIKDEGCSQLGKGLSVNCCLQVLVLCFNQIGDLGFIDLCQGLTNNKNLNVAIFWKNPISGIGYEFLERMLQENVIITRFEFSEPIDPSIDKKIKNHLKFNLSYQKEYPKKYLVTVKQFIELWYYFQQSLTCDFISSELVKVISDFLGVPYYQSLTDWKRELRQQLANQNE